MTNVTHCGKRGAFLYLYHKLLPLKENQHILSPLFIQINNLPIRQCEALAADRHAFSPQSLSTPALNEDLRTDQNFIGVLPARPTREPCTPASRNLEKALTRSVTYKVCKFQPPTIYRLPCRPAKLNPLHGVADRQTNKQMDPVQIVV